MSFTIQQINKAKAVSIMEWLGKKGFKYVKVSGGQYVFYSPFNPDEKSPSFYVRPDTNVFNDFSTGRKGDSIRLVQELYTLDFATAVNLLLEFDGFEIMYEPAQMKERVSVNSYSTIQKILPLHSQNLIEYLQNRRIDIGIAKKWLNEVHYSNPKGTFYGLGFKNDKGGFEMRSPTKNGNVFKCFVGDTKDVRTYLTDANKTITLFEGFTDFLSYLTLYKTPVPMYNALILNSTALLSEKIINRLSEFTTVQSFLDNDKSGFEAFEKLGKYLNPNVELLNTSYFLYPDFHDFNDFLRAQSVPKWQNQKQSNNATKAG